MAIVRRSVEFNSCDSTDGTNAFTQGSGNTSISIQTNTGVELQGAGSTTEKIDNETLTQAPGRAAGGTVTGSFGFWAGSNTWGELTALNAVIKLGGQATPVEKTVPTSYWPKTSGYIPIWVAGAGVEAIGTEVTANNLPGGAGDNFFMDNITQIFAGDVAYAINGTSSISALAAAENVKSTGFNQTVLEQNGIYNFYAGITIGIDGTSTPVLTDFQFSETGETFVLVDQSTMSGTNEALDHLFWRVRLDAASTSTFFMDSCNYQASEPDALNRTTPIGLIFEGTSGSATMLNCNLLDIDDLTLTSTCTIEGGTTRAVSISQCSAHIFGGTIVTQDTQTNGATIDDPSFGTTSGIHDTTFIQGGTGAALDVTSSTTFTGIKFSGYTGLNGEPVINSSSNDVVITRDANTPSFSARQVGLGGTITVQGPDRNFELTGLKDGTEVRLINADTNSSIAGVELIAQGTAFTRAPVTVSGSQDNNTFNYAYQYSSDINVNVAIIHPDGYEIEYLSSTLQDSDKSIPVQQQIDRNYSDPVTNSSNIVVKTLSSFYITGRGTESSPFQGFSLNKGQNLTTAQATFSAAVAGTVNIQASVDNPNDPDDGSFLYIDGTFQSNVWQSGSSTLLSGVNSKSATLSLTAGQTFAIDYDKDIDANAAGDIDRVFINRIVFTPT